MPSSDVNRILRLAGAQSARIKQAFINFVEAVSDTKLLSQVRELLDNRDIDGALSIVESHIVRLGSVLPSSFNAIGQAEVASLAANLAERAGGVILTWDPNYPRAVELSRNNQLEFIRQFNNEQRAATREALATGYAEGLGSRAIAQSFKDSIGLTRAQNRAVANYRDLLNSRSLEALSRNLRDRRSDPKLNRLFSEGQSLSPDQIDSMVERYRANFIRYRAETIARTEGVKVTSLARQEALTQSVEDLQIAPERLSRVWRSTMDSRVRDSHAAMDGQEVGMNEPFVSGNGNYLMYPGDPSAPIEEVANCRCTVSNIISAPS